VEGSGSDLNCGTLTHVPRGIEREQKTSVSTTSVPTTMWTGQLSVPSSSVCVLQKPKSLQSGLHGDT